MIHHLFKRMLFKRHCTLLGVGPMSKNCVDASIDLANRYNLPIMMIASRRQIDSEALGGGYVNGWTTEQFSAYVKERDKRGRIILARDHGGPWQNEKEKSAKLGLRQAMESAKDSFRVDIESGFDVIHIDPSIDLFGDSTTEDILERIYELYEYCHIVSQKCGRKIYYEIGTEEQSGIVNTLDEIEYTFNEMFDFCKKNALPAPTFIVVQIGTKVMEMRNVGTFDSPYRVINELPTEIQVPKMISLCNKYNVYMKTHNTDYLSDEAISWHPKLGIHSSNVAPEFGIAETKAFIKILRENGLSKEYEEFVQISYDSGKWVKWMLPDSTATMEDKAVIGGHYQFSTPEFADLKSRVESKLQKKSIDLDAYLQEAVRMSIMRYLYGFRLLERQ